MATQDFYTLITTIGQAKIANAVALGRTVELSEMAVSDWEGYPTQEQTELHNEVYRGSLNAIFGNDNNPNWITAEAVIPQEEGGWYVREIGIFDKDGDLFAVARYPSTYKPVLAGGAGKDLYIKTILEVSNSEVVELKIDPSVVLASREHVHKMGTNVSEIERQTTQDVLGRQLFYGDACKVVKGSGGYYDLLPGQGYVAGIRFDYPGKSVLVSDTPTSIWLDVSQQGNAMSDIQPVVEVVVSESDQADYVDKSGVKHYVEKISDVDGHGNLIDFRIRSFENNSNVRSPKDLNYWMGIMHAEGKVRIACWGDSTTDGDRTTGSQYNRDTGTRKEPVYDVGQNVGQSYHTTESPNAWGNVLKKLLMDYYPNADIDVWNAGHSGQKMSNGWGYFNYDNAVTLNPHYGTPDICFIGFGLNDIVDAGSAIEEHIKYTELLCLKMLANGTYPVLLTCDANAQQNDDNNHGSGRENEEASRQLEVAKRFLANRLNIGFIDVDLAMKTFFATNEDNHTWKSIQPDYLHYGDEGHAYKAGFIATHLMRDFYSMNGTKVERVFWQDSRSGFSYTLNDIWDPDSDDYSRNIPVWNIAKNRLRASSNIFDFWIYVEHKNPSLIYRSFNNTSSDGVIADTTEKNWLKIQVNNIMSWETPIIDIPAPGSGILAQKHSADRPFFISRLPAGLNRVRLIAPVEPVTSHYGGFFEMVPTWLNSDNAMKFDFIDGNGVVTNDLLPFYQADALRDIGEPYVHVHNPYNDKNINVYRQFRESSDGCNVFSLSKEGDKVEILVDAEITDNCSFGWASGKSHSSTSSNTSGSSLLFEIKTDRLRLYEVTPPLWNALAQYDGEDHFEFEDTELYGRVFKCRFKIIQEKYDEKNVRISIYKDWGAHKTPLLSFDSAQSGLLPPCAGSVGGAWFFVNANKDKMVNFKTVIVRHYRND